MGGVLSCDLERRSRLQVLEQVGDEMQVSDGQLCRHLSSTLCDIVRSKEKARELAGMVGKTSQLAQALGSDSVTVRYRQTDKGDVVCH